MAFGGETVTGSGGSPHSENLCLDLCDHWDFCEGGVDGTELATYLGSHFCLAFNACDIDSLPLTSIGGPASCPSNALRFTDTDADSEVNQGVKAVEETLSCTSFQAIQVWIYPESSIVSSGTLMQKGNAGIDIEWAIGFSPSGGGVAMDFSVSTDGTTITTVASTDIALFNRWSQVICWVDILSEIIYIQVNVNAPGGPTVGTPVSTSISGIPFISVGDIVIGNCSGVTYVSPPRFQGRVDDLAGWNRILTEDERTALYNNGDGLCFDVFGPPNCPCQKCIAKCMVCDECWLDFLKDCCDCCDDCCASATRSVLCDEVCAFYALNEDADTNAIDASDNGFDLTRNGSPGPGAVSDGEVCTARSFNGSDQYFTHTDEDCFSIQQGYTIWGWFRTSNDNQSRILAAKGSSSGTAEWEIRIDTSPSPSRSVTFKMGANSVTVLSAPLFPLNEWVFVSARFDPSFSSGTGAIFLRINGDTIGSLITSSIPSPSPSNDFSLGAYSTGTDPFDGDLDEWGIIKRTLSFTEVESLVGPNDEDGNPCCPITCCRLEEAAAPPASGCAFCTGGTGSPPTTFGATFSGFSLCPSPPFSPTTSACMTQPGDFLGCPQYQRTVGPAFQQVTYRLRRNGTDTAFELDIWNPDLTAPREAYFHGELTTIDCTGDTFTNDYTAGRCGTPATEFTSFWTVAATGGTVTISPGCTPFAGQLQVSDSDTPLYIKSKGVIGINKKLLLKKAIKKRRRK
jgi:hypothetical protein